MNLTLGPIVGALTPTSARIWFFSETSSEFEIVVVGEAGLERRVPATRHPREPRVFLTEVTGLRPGARHTFDIRLETRGGDARRNGSETLSASCGSFRTPPEAGPVRLRFATGSCAKVQQLEDQLAWEGIRARGVDFQLLLGDNVYLPSLAPLFRWRVRSKADVWTPYLQQRRVVGFRMQTLHVPTYAIWDDHDYAWNDAEGDIDERYKRWAREVFEEAWPNPARDAQDGIHYRFTWGDVDFFMLDNRTWRGLGPGDQMLGREQEEWLLEGLRSDARLKVIASGSCLTLGQGWKQQPRARRRVMDFLRQNEIEDVLWLSGDMHRHAVVHHRREQIGHDLVEVISSPIARRTKLLRRRKERYAVIDIDTTGPRPQIAVNFYRGRDSTPFETHSPLTPTQAADSLPES